MKKSLYFGLLMLVSNLSYAEPTFYKMPQPLIEQIKAETKQRQFNDCEQKKLPLGSTDFYTLNNEQLLILIGLPTYMCNGGSFMPVIIDSQGHWQAGAVLENYPALLLTDAAQHLWLVSHFEHEAVFPLLHHSLDGIHWQEINLPKDRNIDCCFEWLKQLCVVKPHIQLKFAGMDDKSIGYWQTTVSDSFKENPKWQKLAAPKFEQCQTTPLSSGDWQRKVSTDDTEVSFHSASHPYTIIVPNWF